MSCHSGKRYPSGSREGRVDALERWQALIANPDVDPSMKVALRECVDGMEQILEDHGETDDE